MLIKDAMRQCRGLDPADGAAGALRMLREKSLAAAPVVAGGTVVGMVREQDLIRLAAPDWPAVAPEAVRATPVRELMVAPEVVLAAGHGVESAVQAFKNCEAAVLPVMDETGAYAGIVLRADVMYGLLSRSIPRSVGGLATPLGVYLTTGNARAGPGEPGLVLAGVAMALMFFAARLVVNLGAWAVQGRYEALPLLSLRLSGEDAYFMEGGLWALAMSAAALCVYLLLLWVSPIARIHGSEHKVVHAIEDGRELTAEAVAAMPRVHRRCGTNLAVAVMLGLVAVAALGGVLGYGAVGQFGLPAEAGWVIAGQVGLLVALRAWRRGTGGAFQALLTTREPSGRVLENGLRAGRQLLERYQANPAAGAGRLRRIWNMGLLQVMAGAVATGYLVALASTRWHLGLWP